MLTRRTMGVPSPSLLRAIVSAAGEGVDRGADDGAVVPDEVDAALSSFAGVGMLVEKERDKSGCVPADWLDVSARAVKAADIPAR